MAIITSFFVTDFLILTSACLIGLYIFSIRKFNYWKSKKVQHRKPIPFFGNFKASALLQKAPPEYLAEVYKETEGDFSGFYLFDEPCLMIKSTELIKSVLIKDFSYFHDRYVGVNHRDDPAGTYNLFNAKNPDWKELRAKITPVFTSGKLKQMFSLIEQNGNDLIKFLKNESKMQHSNEVKDIAGKYVIDLLMNTVFGLNSNCLNDKDSFYWNAGKNTTDFTLSRTYQFMAYFFAPKLVKPFHFKFIENDACAFLRNIFQSSIKQREEAAIKRNDLIDIIIKMKKGMS